MNYDGNVTRTNRVVDLVLDCVIPYINDPKDRDAVSQVCQRWFELDSLTRKHVTIALCYTTTPERLRRRFPHLESLKLKGKPRAAMFNLIPEDWGGHVSPWVREISQRFDCIRSLHFRRMIVRDSDLELLARTRGHVLLTLKLDKCSGFSTHGLSFIGRFCRNLRVLVLEESSIVEHDGQWLHELALNNTVLETLNFYLTDIAEVIIQDLELLAKNCPKLVAVKITDCEILDLKNFFRYASALEEFSGGAYNEEPERYSSVSLPAKLCRLGLTYIGKNELPIVLVYAAVLKKLDLLYAMLDTEDHCVLIQRCPNLEVLETRNVIGDRGLEVLARYCRRLKRLRIERGEDDQGMEDEEGVVSQRGLIALSQGCPELEYLAVYVSDITNAALEQIGTHLRYLDDFRLVLLDHVEEISDLPLDNGVRALLTGCDKLERFALYLRPGGLTDIGLGYIGKYSQHVRWMLLGFVGESDAGLLEMSKGCPNLQKLEIRGCSFFSERALAVAVTQLTSLRYLWVQGYGVSQSAGRDLLAMARPFWNIELIPSRYVPVIHYPDQPAIVEPVTVEHPAHILAYYSLVGQRSDFPASVIPLDPTTYVDV
ncbi:putative leucine-rich repeat domain, L domain-containing protein [Lupinus albus]|uniref:Putative leucine-rich repeat domain, L domain-containing protein n=1 Tax=Lupinus albus TaxID=3870 RepID=A0A6A4P9P4_LUPAL|nr:putative leucine-rich repeat domain, L domain-containing protein [Lupinus albus]